MPKDKLEASKTKFDYLGATFLIPALITIIYSLNMGLKLGWMSPVIVECYVIAILPYVRY